MQSRPLATLWPAVLSLLLGGFAVAPLGAQPKSRDKDAASTPAIKLPSGAIIVVTSDPNSIDKSASIYLTPERYRELTDQIELLKKQIAAEKPSAPSACELEGRLEQRGMQTVVRLRATFKFRTTQPRSAVSLGCQKMQLIEAKREDGKLPLLAASDRGLWVMVEEAGEQTIRLELESALISRGAKSSEVGFEVGLPGAAITLLSFATPSKVKRVTVSRREVASAPVFGSPLIEGPLDVKRVDVESLQAGGGAPFALGSITYLAVSWEDEKRMVGGATARTSEADVQVTIGDADIVTEARMRLKGAASEWRFLAPSNAEVSIGKPPTAAGGKPLDFPIDQAPELIRPEPGQSTWRVRFREANSSELLAVIVMRTPRSRTEPKSKSFLPIGPFFVFDAARQSGAIRVKTLPHIKVIPILKGDTQRLDNGQDLDGEMLFRYRAIPQGTKSLPTAPLELDIRPAIGVVQTRVHHQLRMAEGSWRLHSEIAVVPIRMDVDVLELEVPAAVAFEAATPKLVESISALRDISPSRRVVQVKLASAQRSEFTIAIEGYYPLPIGAQEMNLLLPRVLNTFDRLGQVSVSLPDGFDVRGRAYQWESDKPGTQQYGLIPAPAMDKPSLLTASVSRSISHVELDWKAQRADIRAESQVDLTLGDRRAQISHTLKFQFADRVPRRLRIRASAPVSGLAVSPGSLETNGALDWFVNLGMDVSKEATIVLNYSFPLPAEVDDPSLLHVPLLWPDGVNWCENRVRVWRDSQATRSFLPEADGTVWEVRPPELLAREQSLPLLVLHAAGSNLPLALRLIEAASPMGFDSTATLTAVWIDRTLIQAQISGAYQQYRVRFHLSKWSARVLEVELPAGAIDAEASINGIRIETRTGRPNADAARNLQLVLPAWRERMLAIVEIKYQLADSRNDGPGRLVTVWQPPRLPSQVALSTVRWQIAVPANSVALSLGGSAFEERWTVRGGIAQPLPAYTSPDLENWITSGREPDGSETPAGWEMENAGIIARQNSLMPMRTAAVPRPAFIATVSLIVLAMGLLMARLPRRAVGVLLTLLTAGAVVVGFIWPQPSGQVLSAAQPGLVLLALVLCVQRFSQWRYRRRLTRMPGFARVHAESAVARSNGNRVPRETSTVDSPAAS